MLDAAWHDFVAKGRDLPDSAEFSLDVRCQDRNMLEAMHALVLQHVTRIENERAVHFDLGQTLRTSPALCSQPLIARLTEAAETVRVQPALIP
ncbi:hypothetical protein [Neorhizobium tomejilense]|uniref:hypothetical protein n=1 Tax=Neorhizobium tomejilense TaxID=2093828 RepID=UPI003ECF2900